MSSGWSSHYFRGALLQSPRRSPFGWTGHRSLLLLAFCGCALAGALRAADRADLLLAAATDAELQPLLAKMPSAHREQRAAWVFWSGTLAGKSVVLTRTEGDPLNAVAAVTLAIRHYAPRLVVTYGSVRPHDPALRPGDGLVSRAFVAFDGLISETAAGGAGVHPLTWDRLPHAVMTRGGKEQYRVEFPADEHAREVALKLTTANGPLHAVVLGSANQVNREADRIAWIREHWQTSSEDPESAHIAGAALVLDTPVIGLRIVEGSPAECADLARRFVEAAP